MKLHPVRFRRKRPAKKKPEESPLDQALNYPHLWRVILIALLAAGVLVGLYHLVDIDAVHDYADRVNPFGAFALLTLLPLVGFPVNVLHIATGIRFGFVLGMVVVAASILLQLLASYAIIRMWPNLFKKRLAKIRAMIPPAAHSTVCIFTLLLPGVPFFLQNYTLPLVGVPLRIYLSRCLPLHTLRAVLTVGLGQQSGHFTPLGIAALSAYWILVLIASWWTFQRLRRQLEDQPSAAGGRKQPA